MCIEPQAVWRGEYSNSMPVVGLLDEVLRVSQVGRRVVDEASSGWVSCAYKYGIVYCVARCGAVGAGRYSLEWCLDSLLSGNGVRVRLDVVGRCDGRVRTVVKIGVCAVAIGI